MFLQNQTSAAEKKESVLYFVNLALKDGERKNERKAINT